MLSSWEDNSLIYIAQEEELGERFKIINLQNSTVKRLSHQHSLIAVVDSVILGVY